MGSDTWPAKELTVCDIMGDWGAYQWSLTFFGLIYSAIFSMTVVVGPIWTPDMNHVCAPSMIINTTSMTTIPLDSPYNEGGDSADERFQVDFSEKPHECFVATQTADSSQASGERDTAQVVPKCSSFIYDDQEHGKVLTNSFDLVCDRQWLRSFISSSSLIGMLLSSVTLGLLSDKFGRLCCIRTGFVISILATIGAILSHNYFLLNICFVLMSYAQVGVANAICTLVMEATTPKWRFVPVFEYGIGWGLGILLSPLLHTLTKNYQHFLMVCLAANLVLCLWLHWGVFESIRWLLSEGKINRAQIELQRACRINNIENGAELAQKIAQVQQQQVRKASQFIEAKQAPARLAQAMQQELETATQELNVLGSAIRRSFALSSSPESPPTPTINILDNVSTTNTGGGAAATSQLVLSPTLARRSFALSGNILPEPTELPPKPLDLIMMDGSCSSREQARHSITTQALIQLALKYSKTIQEQEEGKCFLTQIFHRKLYKLTIVLMLLSIMLETSYFGLIQANKFVGNSVTLNYMTGALGEWVANLLFMLVLWAFSRRVAIILPTLLSALACFGIALAYHLIPDHQPHEGGMNDSVRLNVNEANITGLRDQVDSIILNDNQASNLYTNDGGHHSGNFIGAKDGGAEMVELRETINFCLMTIGKLTIAVTIQVSSTIGMEAYPNNLRQTGLGAIVLVGRLGSICAPFLFNDSSDDKLMFKMTLVVLSAIGMIVCLMVPFFLRDTTDKDLCDRLNDIEED